MGRNGMFKRKIISLVLVSVLLVTGMTGQTASAKKKPAISQKKLVLTVGAKKKLKIKNTKQKVKWSSKNKKIATVSKTGVVKAKKKGSVKIIAKVGKKKYTCKVTVKNKKATVTAKPGVVQTPSPTITGNSIPTAPPLISETPQVTKTPEPTDTPEPPVITLRPTDDPNLDPDWAEGKKSGSEEDFKKYFDLTVKDYYKIQEGAVLGTIESITYSYKGGEREAYVYLPPYYSADKEYPVLYMIHGLGESREQWIDYSANSIISNMICSGETGPMVAVIPTVDDYDSFDREFTDALEPYILENYSVSSDSKDTGICGLSMGGMEALYIGFSLKDHFNYIGSFSASGMGSYGKLLTLDGWNTTPELVMLCSGSNDNTVGDAPYHYHETLEKNQVDHIWYLHPKAGHSMSVWTMALVNFLRRSYR